MRRQLPSQSESLHLLEETFRDFHAQSSCMLYDFSRNEDKSSSKFFGKMWLVGTLEYGDPPQDIMRHHGK